MTELFKPLDFSKIASAPHAIPKDAIKKLPIFQGNNAITTKSHLWKFEKHLVNYWNDAAHDHDDVKMKLFVLSLEDDAKEWYLNLDDDSYKTLSKSLEGFKKKWGENKEPKHLLAALYSIKKMENETMDEFNTKFMRVVVDLPRDIKPKNASILILYIEAFMWWLKVQVER